jgi:hypothetical protein
MKRIKGNRAISLLTALLSEAKQGNFSPGFFCQEAKKG